MSDNVRCMHGFAKQYCENNGIEYDYEKDYPDITSCKKENKNYCVFAVVDGVLYHDPIKKMRKKVEGGGFYWLLKAYDNRDVEDIKIDINFKPERVFARRYRSWVEFKDSIKGAGTYNDSLGGGWYSKVPKYEYNGKFYADMECACL